MEDYRVRREGYVHGTAFTYDFFAGVAAYEKGRQIRGLGALIVAICSGKTGVAVDENRSEYGTDSGKPLQSPNVENHNLVRKSDIASVEFS